MGLIGLVCLMGPLAAAETYQIPQTRQARHQSPTLAAVWSGIRPGTEFGRAVDVGNQAHEDCHELHSQLRQRHGGSDGIGCWAMPVEGRYVALPTFRARLRDVAAAIPSDERGQSYQLYLVSQAAWWDDHPLYPFDEWFACFAGTQTDIELGQRDYHRLEVAAEFAGYCAAVCRVAYASRSYPEDCGLELCESYRWGVRRVAELLDAAGARGLPTGRAPQILAAHVARYGIPESRTGTPARHEAAADGRGDGQECPSYDKRRSDCLYPLLRVPRLQVPADAADHRPRLAPAPALGRT